MEKIKCSAPCARSLIAISRCRMRFRKIDAMLSGGKGVYSLGVLRARTYLLRIFAVSWRRKNTSLNTKSYGCARIYQAGNVQIRVYYARTHEKAKIKLHFE